MATPPSPSGGDTLGLKTSTFLTEYDLQAAINAAPFSPVHSRERSLRDVQGLQISQGRLVSEDNGHNPALLITRDNIATISKPPFDTARVYNAVAGFDW